METHILKEINKYLTDTTSIVQRYYLYKELRKQLMRIFYKDFGDDDCPYIAGNADALIFVEEGGEKIQRKARDISEVKKHYPFVEEHESDSSKIKFLPFFAESE